MSCTDCESNEIKYAGNGVQVLFTFPFTYMDQDDVYVEFFNYNTRRWVDATDPVWLGAGQWTFANATTIEFTTAPEFPVDTEIESHNIKIARCTDIDPLSATFYPGSAIRAQDLNNNFEQLQLAIQEGRCKVPDWLYDYLDDNYWNKIDETIYCDDDWVSDDEHVASTCALDKRYFQKEDIIVKEEQQNGTVKLKLDDEHIFSAAASAARHDAYVQADRPKALAAEQEGKIWNDTDAVLDYFWDEDQQVWVSFTKAGPPGIQGLIGPPGKVIIGDNPPMMYPEGYGQEARELESGDLWWDSYHVLLYVYYVDDNGPGQWVAVSKTGPQGNPGEPGEPGQNGGIPEAPSDGDIYGRQNESWVSIPDDVIGDAPTDGATYGRQNGQWEEVQEPLTFTAPLVKDNSNDVAFVWASMNSLP